MTGNHMVFSIPIYPLVFFVPIHFTPLLSYSLINYQKGDEKMRKCPSNKDVLCRSVDSRNCEYCEEFYRYHAEEY